MSALMQEWTEKLADWSNSGLSIAAWCRQNDEGYHRFLYWRKRLGTRQPGGTGRFVELRLGQSPLCLECNGIRIHVERGFDSGLLGDILSLLKKV